MFLKHSKHFTMLSLASARLSRPCPTHKRRTASPDAMQSASHCDCLAL